jgi:hypothetical protein
MMRLDVLIPVVLLAFAIAFVITRGLALKSPLYRIGARLAIGVLLSAVFLLIYTGDIRPFYAAYVLMAVWIVVQRLFLVRENSGAVVSEDIGLD